MGNPRPQIRCGFELLTSEIPVNREQSRSLPTSRLHITNPPKLPITPFLANFRFVDNPPRTSSFTFRNPVFRGHTVKAVNTVPRTTT